MYQSYTPDIELSPFVECYWHWAIHKYETGHELILPDAAPELIVHLASPPDFWHESDGWTQQPEVFFYCAATRMLPLRISRPMDVFAIRFRPWGVSRFGTGPMSELLDRAVPPQEVLGSPGSQLVSALKACKNHKQRVAMANHALLAALASDAENTTAIDTLIKAIGGAANPASEMANALNRSPRTVSRTWQKMVGISPRAYAKLMRFHRALKWIDEGRPLVWVAAQCGYADQAHMARHIKDIAGVPPSLLRERLGDPTYQNLYLQREAAPWRGHA